MSTIFRENGDFKIKTGKARNQHSGSIRAPKSGNRSSILNRNSYSQKCIVKTKYNNLGSEYGIKASSSHLKYILRSSALEGAPDTAHFDPTVKTSKEFRIILSPENPVRDMVLFTKLFIERLQKETGFKFNYLSCVHKNTAHKHSHILIKGTDLNGKKVEFSKFFIQHRMRAISCQLATEFLGPALAVNNNYDPFIEKFAVTKLDRKLKDIIRDGNIITEKTLNLGTISNELIYCRKRLIFLESQGLVFWKNSTWKFADNWYSKLSDYSRCSTFLEAARYIRHSNPTSLELYDHNKHGTICGMRTHKGLSDESTNKQYALIETANGKAVYCHLGSVINSLKPGQMVSYNPGKAFEISKTQVLKNADKNILTGYWKKLYEDAQYDRGI